MALNCKKIFIYIIRMHRVFACVVLRNIIHICHGPAMKTPRPFATKSTNPSYMKNPQSTACLPKPG